MVLNYGKLIKFLCTIGHNLKKRYGRRNEIRRFSDRKKELHKQINNCGYNNLKGDFRYF